MPTPKEQILFLLILSGKGQLHAYEELLRLCSSNALCPTHFPAT